MTDETARTLINLDRASVLLIEDNPQGMEILVQVLLGFGVKTFRKCATVAEAKLAVAKTPVDLIITDGLLADEDGYGFTRWLRRETSGANRFVPVIMVTGHTQKSRVEQGRDCGANFIVAKPLTPTTLFERIEWVARENRPFVEVDTYVGPDRRFKFEGPPAGTNGRRRGDLSGDVGLAQEPNMSQSEIDNLVQPQKVSL